MGLGKPTWTPRPRTERAASAGTGPGRSHGASQAAKQRRCVCSSRVAVDLRLSQRFSQKKTEHMYQHYMCPSPALSKCYVYPSPALAGLVQLTDITY